MAKRAAGGDLNPAPLKVVTSGQELVVTSLEQADWTQIRGAVVTAVHFKMAQICGDARGCFATSRIHGGVLAQRPTDKCSLENAAWLEKFAKLLADMAQGINGTGVLDQVTSVRYNGDALPPNFLQVFPNLANFYYGTDREIYSPEPVHGAWSTVFALGPSRIRTLTLGFFYRDHWLTYVSLFGQATFSGLQELTVPMLSPHGAELLCTNVPQLVSLTVTDPKNTCRFGKSGVFEELSKHPSLQNYSGIGDEAYWHEHPGNLELAYFLNHHAGAVSFLRRVSIAYPYVNWMFTRLAQAVTENPQLEHLEVLWVNLDETHNRGYTDLVRELKEAKGLRSLKMRFLGRPDFFTVNGGKFPFSPRPFDLTCPPNLFDKVRGFFDTNPLARRFEVRGPKRGRLPWVEGPDLGSYGEFPNNTFSNCQAGQRSYAMLSAYSASCRVVPLTRFVVVLFAHHDLQGLGFGALPIELLKAIRRVLEQDDETKRPWNRFQLGY
jgi:hypothetical protein